MVSICHQRHTKVRGALPQHIAVIMDGNGRWAQKRALPRSAGHRKGAHAIREALKGCQKFGIRYLTLYAFSSENWQRSKEEVDQLMELLRYYLEHELKSLHEQGIKLHIFGDITKFDQDIIDKIREAEALTKHNTALTLNIALNYGARQEILRAVMLAAKDMSKTELNTTEIDEACFSTYLYTADLPDPDLLIRTGGEQRLSNFLLWQLAYTELVFLDILWPDFKAQDLEDAVNQFKIRERRYGT